MLEGDEGIICVDTNDAPEAGSSDFNYLLG